MSFQYRRKQRWIDRTGPSLRLEFDPRQIPCADAPYCQALVTYCDLDAQVEERCVNFLMLRFRNRRPRVTHSDA